MHNPLLISLLALASLLVVIPTALSATPGRHWVLRVCDFPRAQLLWLILLLLIAAAAIATATPRPFRGGWGLLLGVSTVVLGASALVQLFWAIRLTPLYPREIKRSRIRADKYHKRNPRVPHEGILRLVTANVDYQNRDRQQAIEQLVRWRPHLLALVETDAPWRTQIESLRDAYPWSVTEYRPEGRGVALLSRFPIESWQIRCLVDEDRPSIWARVHPPSAPPVGVVVLHPPPPGLPRKGDDDGRVSSRPRDIEIDLVASIIAQHPTDLWLMTGDFNDVGWSATTVRAKRVSALGDPRVGRAVLGTFPARWPLLRYPIDHALVSRALRLVMLKRLAPIGSDHLPLLLDLELPPGPGATTHAEDHLIFNPCQGKTIGVSTHTPCDPPPPPTPNLP